MFDEDIKKLRLIPLTEWEKFHPWPTTAGLRHLVFFADKKGFSDVVVRKAGRVLINEQKFFEWAEKTETPVYDR